MKMHEMERMERIGRIVLFFFVIALLAGCAGRERRYVETGVASWHAPSMFSSESQTASGEKWWNFKMVAAHKTLPMGSIVRVTNLNTGRSVKVRLIDRGPYIAGRIIDVSKSAASKLQIRQSGTAPVRIEVVKWP